MSSHLIPKLHDGEMVLEITCFKHIQSILYGNINTLKYFKERYIKYGIIYALIITEYYSMKAAHPFNKWSGPDTSKSLFDHLSFFTLEYIKYFQHGTMSYY